MKGVMCEPSRLQVKSRTSDREKTTLSEPCFGRYEGIFFGREGMVRAGFMVPSQVFGRRGRLTKTYCILERQYLALNACPVTLSYSFRHGVHHQHYLQGQRWKGNRYCECRGGGGIRQEFVSQQSCLAKRRGGLPESDPYLVSAKLKMMPGTLLLDPKYKLSSMYFHISFFYLRNEMFLPSSNSGFAKKPAAVVVLGGVSDCSKTMAFASKHQLLMSVLGGGHNVTGSCLCDGGLVLNMRRMNQTFVDPLSQKAITQGGTNWGEFCAETYAYRLATTGGIGTTRICIDYVYCIYPFVGTHLSQYCLLMCSICRSCRHWRSRFDGRRWYRLLALQAWHGYRQR